MFPRDDSLNTALRPHARTNIIATLLAATCAHRGFPRNARRHEDLAHSNGSSKSQ